MTTYLRDILDEDQLSRHIAQGNIRVQTHPLKPHLSIYNYTEQAQFSRAWDEVTTQTRGLIVNTNTSEVLARPFPKFFNHDEPSAPRVDLDIPVTVTDKMDGSLGILYPDGSGRYAVATRGSFASDQARVATLLWRQHYAHRVTVPEDWTPLFEIIYPANRIVVDYGGQEDLVLLGVVRISDGLSLDPDFEHLNWPGPRTESFPYPTLGHVLAQPPRAGREGFVVHVKGTETRVKVKYEDYVRLHKLVTGLNERAVWEHLAERRPIEEMLNELPDEFHGWVWDVRDELCAKAEQIHASAHHTFHDIMAEMPEGFDRKDFALKAKDSPYSKYLFLMLDNRSIADVAWKAIRPVGETGIIKATTEDAA